MPEESSGAGIPFPMVKLTRDNSRSRVSFKFSGQADYKNDFSINAVNVTA